MEVHETLEIGKFWEQEWDIKTWTPYIMIGGDLNFAQVYGWPILKCFGNFSSGDKYLTERSEWKWPPFQKVPENPTRESQHSNKDQLTNF